MPQKKIMIVYGRSYDDVKIIMIGYDASKRL